MLCLSLSLSARGSGGGGRELNSSHFSFIKALPLFSTIQPALPNCAMILFCVNDDTTHVHIVFENASLRVSRLLVYGGVVVCVYDNFYVWGLYLYTYIVTDFIWVSERRRLSVCV